MHSAIRELLGQTLPRTGRVAPGVRETGGDPAHLSAGASAELGLLETCMAMLSWDCQGSAGAALGNGGFLGELLSVLGEPPNRKGLDEQ